MEIKLGNSDYIATIEDKDYYKIEMHNWHRDGDGYASTNVWDGKHNKRLKMHRLIMEAQKGQEIDHINGNRLDNRKENLRLCTRTQNNANQKVRGTGKYSKFKGVTKVKRKYWFAQLTIGGKRVLQKYCVSELEAAKAYDEAAIKYFGNFANINFRGE